MEALDTVSIAILLGSLLVLAGVLSILLAMRFGAALLLVFLLIGVLAGESGPGGLTFNDVGTAYTVGSIALALIREALFLDLLPTCDTVPSPFSLFLFQWYCRPSVSQTAQQPPDPVSRR